MLLLLIDVTSVIISYVCVQMAGFLCMLWGSVTYYAIIRYPRLEYPVTINAQPPEQADFKLLEERQ